MAKKISGKSKRALILVDIQKGFVKDNQAIVSNIIDLLKKKSYDLYIEACFHADKGSIWDRQLEWTFNREPTIPEIAAELKTKSPLVKVLKQTKSVFGGNKDIRASLKKHGIGEIHIVGFDTNDCVLATAFDSFDAGYFTYVLEKCTGSSEGNKIHKHAIAILKHVGLLR